MRAVTTSDLEKFCQGRVLYQGPLTQFSGIGTDTRKNLAGQIFFALKGEAFDAHDFLTAAVSQGAAGLLVHRPPTDEEMKAWNVTVILVKDTLQALQALARSVRQTFRAQVVGITGSNGKTSTKEFLATLLQDERQVHWNPGSFNNHFGLPFNLLQTPATADVVIAEMGMNHAGELTELAQIALPDVVVCTMVGSAHMEHFGSGEKIAAAKEEIYQAAPPSAVRIYNLDNPWTAKMWKRARTDYPTARLLTFSNQAAVSAADVVLVKDENNHSLGLSLRGQIGGVAGRATTSLLGDHNVVNLAAAAACALALGLKPEVIWRHLEKCEAHWGRMQLLTTEKGPQVLFDGYNANPESMEALLASLQTPNMKKRIQAGKVYGVFAEMRELGESAEEAHQKLGQKVAAAGLEKVYFYGPSAAAFLRGYEREAGAEAAKKSLIVSDGYEETLAFGLASVLNPKDLVVVKGSRGMKTERFALLLRPLGFHAK